MCDSRQLGFVGAGNMAEAIARGVLSAKLFAPADLMASDPAEARRKLFEDELKISAVSDNAQLARSCAAIVLAVKPQSMAEALTQLSEHLGPDTLIISIAAGISTGYIANSLGGQGRRVVRVMPNTPMLVGAGMSALAPGRGATEQDMDFAQSIFQAGGEALVVDESLMDAVTAVSGSGPAYFFYFLEAMVAGGVEAGLSEPDATKLARQTMLGAAQLLIQSGEPPAELRRKVTSPGGTTEAALRAMGETGVPQYIQKAVLAAAERSRQLGR